MKELLKYDVDQVLQLDVIIRIIIDYKNDKYTDNYISNAKIKMIEDIRKDNFSQTTRKVSTLINLFKYYF